MKMAKMLFLLIIIVIILIVWFCYSKTEAFTDMDLMKYLKELTSTKHENDIFENAVVYLNDIWDGYDMTGGRMGIDKCISECRGNCVELGVTGDSVCYNPLVYKYDYNKGNIRSPGYGAIKNPSLTTEKE